MNKAICWYCDKEFKYSGEKYRDVKCSYCKVLNSIFNPDRPDWKPEVLPTTEDEWIEEEEEEMSPNVNDLNTYLTHTDVVDGDVVTFIDEGTILEKDFSQEKDGSDVRSGLDINIELPSGKQKLYSPNKTTRTALAEKWGPDTPGWVGKKASVMVVKQNVGGNIKKVIYMEPVA